MQIDDAAMILASADFFEICTDEQRRMLAFASERKRYPAGTVISKAGDVPDGAMVLASGTISVTPESENEPNPFIVSEVGAVIGAMALIVGRPRELTVRAINIVEMIFVPRHAFLKLANQSPDLAERAAERIRHDLGSFVSAIDPIRDRMSKQ
jgi:CRP-like cAMP-binding protein